MKLFLQYLRHHRRPFLLTLSFPAIFAAIFLLYRLPMVALLYPAILCAIVGAVYLALDFARVKRNHDMLQRIRSVSDIPAQSLPPCDSVAEEDYQQLIRLFYEESETFQTAAVRRYADMIDYYTVWVHQIKTPIASMRLSLQNEDSPQARRLTSDLHRIEQYVEMVLAFLRLNSETTDYVIREYSLDKIVRSAVKKFSSEFISRRLRLIYEPLNYTVITDEKWLSFVIEQVLSNALKYTPSGSISITLESGNILRIRDTGMGIAPEDLPRIFENGYTGYHGRADHKASGIGLYLCKKICSNLGHTISASSEVDAGTAIDIHLSRRRLEFE